MPIFNNRRVRSSLESPARNRGQKHTAPNAITADNASHKRGAIAWMAAARIGSGAFETVVRASMVLALADNRMKAAVVITHHRQGNAPARPFSEVDTPVMSFRGEIVVSCVLRFKRPI